MKNEPIKAANYAILYTQLDNITWSCWLLNSTNQATVATNPSQKGDLILLTDDQYTAFNAAMIAGELIIYNTETKQLYAESVTS